MGGTEPAATKTVAFSAIGGAQVAKKRKKTNRSAKESGSALPERLALTLIDPTALIGGTGGLTGGTGQTVPTAPTAGATGVTSPLSGAMDNLGSVASQAQQSGPGATAENIGSDGATSSATAPPTER